MHVLIGIGALALLFVVYGLLMRGREGFSCHNCSCKGEICERTGEPRHLELMEHRVEHKNVGS
jgi:hypothetical protein